MRNPSIVSKLHTRVTVFGVGVACVRGVRVACALHSAAETDVAEDVVVGRSSCRIATYNPETFLTAW